MVTMFQTDVKCFGPFRQDFELARTRPDLYNVLATVGWSPCSTLHLFTEVFREKQKASMPTETMNLNPNFSYHIVATISVGFGNHRCHQSYVLVAEDETISYPLA